MWLFLEGKATSIPWSSYSYSEKLRSLIGYLNGIGCSEDFRYV